MFPQLFHIGKFFLPTYGLLVSTGVLLGLWISVRNSGKQGINPDDAWNLGVLVVLCGIVGAKILYIVNDWGYYSTHPGDIFSWSHAAGRRRIFRRVDRRSRGGGLVHPQAPHARAGHLGCLCARPGFWTRHRPSGMLRRRLLLWQTDQSFLGRDFHQSRSRTRIRTLRWAYRSSRRSFSKQRSSWQTFLFLMWIFKRKKFDGQVLAAYLDSVRHRTLFSGIHSRRSRPR